MPPKKKPLKKEVDVKEVSKRAVARLRKLRKEKAHDKESLHGDAENVLLDVLKELGARSVAREFLRMSKDGLFWYS